MGLGAKTKMNTKMRGRKRKRATTEADADVAMDFAKFPAARTRPHTAPFRERVKEFLSSEAVPTAAVTWQVPLRLRLSDGSPAAVPLHVVEEDVTASSRSLYCDHCRVVGWSGHPVCRKRYHFIIRRDHDESETTKSVEVEVEDNNTHLLHAVVHSNGFGHLLTLNGRHGGSAFLSGRQLMDFWDRLSLSLSVRKISVMDVSKKHGAEWRLLHAVGRGRSWYGEWGYEFGAGSYAVTRHAYREALRSLSATPLAAFLQPRARSPSPACSRLRSLVSSYRALASPAELANFRDLFSLLLDLVPRACSPSSSPCARVSGDVERLQQGMVKVLRASTNGWVAGRALKGAVCKSASLMQLLDHCLKHLAGTVVGDGALVVHSRRNSSSSAVEFRLEPLNETSSGTATSGLIYPSEEQVISDLKFLYDSLLHPDTILDDIPRTLRDGVIDSATKLLDCKQFVKVYMPDKLAEEDGPGLIRLWCEVQQSDQAKDEAVIPAELVVLPSDATVGDLKSAVTLAFREVYVMLKSFQAEGLTEYGSLVDDSMTLKFLVGSSGSVRLVGKCASKHGLGRFRMERGVESWTVDCSCGAKDDDGERMLACDTCGVWQHTRCVGIANSDAIPAEFVCSSCTELCPDEPQNIAGSGEDVPMVSLSSTTCRGKAAAFGGVGFTANLAIASDVR